MHASYTSYMKKTYKYMGKGHCHIHININTLFQRKKPVLCLGILWTVFWASNLHDAFGKIPDFDIVPPSKVIEDVPNFPCDVVDLVFLLSLLRKCGLVNTYYDNGLLILYIL